MRTAIDRDALDVTLRTRGPWRRVDVLAEAESTNALALAAEGPWEVVLAELQTRGRGRLDRSWEAPAGASLTFSATVPLPPAPGWAPLAAGLAAAEAVTAVTGLLAVLKWPNDVLLPGDGERKLAGVLCELRPATPRAAGFVVVGVGLNVDQTRAELPVPTATSLALAGWAAPERSGLLVAILDRLADRSAALVAGGAAAEGVRAAYRAACVTVGAEVRLGTLAGATVRARAVGIDQDGALLVDPGSGIERYAAGDVTHVRPTDTGVGLA